MRVTSVVFLFCLVLALPARALAGSYFSVPSWLDYYLVLALMASGIAWCLMLATKPAGVPIFGLGQVTLSPIPAFFYRLLKGTLLVFVALVGLGLYLVWQGG